MNVCGDAQFTAEHISSSQTDCITWRNVSILNLNEVGAVEPALSLFWNDLGVAAWIRTKQYLAHADCYGWVWGRSSGVTVDDWWECSSWVSCESGSGTGAESISGHCEATAAHTNA